MATAELRRVNRTEGWELDVSETDADVGRSTFRERLAENNKLWALCLVGLVIAVLFLASTLGSEERASMSPKDSAIQPGVGSAHDSAHTQFANHFVSKYGDRFNVIVARFVGPDKFRIVVPASVDWDNVEFVAKTAGLQIVTRLKIRPVVQVYTRSVTRGTRLAAIAQWNPEKYGFVVRTVAPSE